MILSVLKPGNRKVTYRLYPTIKQRKALTETLTLHQRLYNAALEQRKIAYRRQRCSVSYAEQCRDLTALRTTDPDYAALNAQSAQVTLKRVDLAFKAFFRRVQAGNGKAGYPPVSSRSAASRAGAIKRMAMVGVCSQARG